MNKTDPCKYYYIDAANDPNPILSDEWIKSKSELKKYVVANYLELLASGHEESIKDLLQPDIMESLGTLNEFVKAHEFSETGELITDTAEQLLVKCKDVLNVEMPTAFAEIGNKMPAIARFIVVYIGKASNYQAMRHFHMNRPTASGNWSNEDMRTVTIVIPYKTVAPVTETVKMQWIEYSPEKEKELRLSLIKNMFLYYEDEGAPIQEIKMPEPGQYLVLDFNSSKCLHWVENNDNQNEYICLVAEY